MFFDYSEVRNIHLEVSEVCNAACPMCARFVGKGSRPNPELTHSVIDLQYFKIIFPPEFVKQLHFINFCGVVGDPITAKELIDQLKYLVECNPNISFEISTNGGVRSQSWWKELAQICNSDKRFVSFSIDGLEDTNHLYRRNVQWHKLMENVKAFIQAGGHAKWQFLIFKHNEHQQDEVKKLAKELEFQECNFKLTNRFVKNNDTISMPVENIENTKKLLELEETVTRKSSPPPGMLFMSTPLDKSQPITIPANFKYNVSDLKTKKSTHALEPASDFKPKEFTVEQLENATIECSVWKKHEIYITARGEIVPCCYLGGRTGRVIQVDESYKKIVEKVQGFDKLVVTESRSIKDIMESSYFRDIIESWKIKKIEDGRISTCAEKCGLNNRVIHNKVKI
jgi:MoaA/NifB/PqqE/SkfB family radical SAM enzyme